MPPGPMLVVPMTTGGAVRTTQETTPGTGSKAQGMAYSVFKVAAREGVRVSSQRRAAEKSGGPGVHRWPCWLWEAGRGHTQRALDLDSGGRGQAGPSTRTVPWLTALCFSGLAAKSPCQEFLFLWGSGLPARLSRGKILASGQSAVGRDT